MFAKDINRMLIISLAAVCLLFAPFSSVTAQTHQATDIRIMIDGVVVSFEQTPINERGSVFVPMRGLFEYFGAELYWDSYTRTVEARKDYTTIRLEIGSTQARVEDLYESRAVELNAPPFIHNNYTYVPARFISESLGAEVAWDAENRMVSIYTDPTLAEKLSSIQSLDDAPHQWKTPYAHFYGDENASVALLQRYGEYLAERVIPELSVYFPSVDLEDRTPPSILILTEERNNRVWQLALDVPFPETAVGFYLGRHNLIVFNGKYGEGFNPILLAHEYVHWVAHQATSYYAQIPNMLEESMAVHISWAIYENIREWNSSLASDYWEYIALSEEPVRSIFLDIESEQFTEPRDPDTDRLWMTAEASFLAEQFGFARMEQYFQLKAKLGDNQAAFEQAFGTTFEQYHAMFKSKVASVRAVVDSDTIQLYAVNKDGKWGYHNLADQEVFPPIYDHAQAKSSNGIYVVMIGEKYGYVRASGVKSPVEYDYIDTYISDQLVRVRIGNSWGFSDITTGQLAVPAIFDEVGFQFSEGLLHVKKDGRWGYVDRAGNPVIPLQFFSAGPFVQGIAEVSIPETEFSGRTKFIDKSGAFVMENHPYDTLSNGGEGLFKVGSGSKYGFIDISGDIVIPIIYDWAGSFGATYPGLAIVMQGDTYFYIDRSGNKVPDPE